MSSSAAQVFDLRTARMNAGYSIRGLAAATGVPAASISRLENGLGVTLPNAKALADFFEVRVTDLEPFRSETSA